MTCCKEWEDGRRDGSGVDVQFMCVFFLKTKTRKNHIFEEYSIRYIYAAFPHTFNGLAKFFISKHTFCQSLFVKKLAQHEQFRCEEVGARGYPTIKYGDPDDLQDGNPRG